MANRGGILGDPEEVNFYGKRRIQSRVKTRLQGEEKSLIQMTPQVKNGERILKLDLILATPEHRLPELMRAFLCYAADNGYTRVELQDDALLGKDPCQFRGLTYRALLGEPGIYSKYGFRPTAEIQAILPRLAAYTVEQALAELLPLRDLLFPEDKRDFVRVLSQAAEPGETLGQYIQRKPECDRGFLLNKIYTLATKIERAGRRNLFLEDFLKYYNAHGRLTAIPECRVQGGKRKHRRYHTRRGSLLRRKSRKTRRSR